jgi:ketosteroid isomerase-like protein
MLGDEMQEAPMRIPVLSRKCGFATFLDPRGVLQHVLATLTAVVAIGVNAQPDIEPLRRQVDAAERAFAKSMADRDHAAFRSWLSEHAVFYGGAAPLIGKTAVAAGWKPFFDAPQAPFSWVPDRIDVLADGALAHSTGLVRDPAGKPFARFNSVWRQEAPGAWRVVFDKGSPLTAAERDDPIPAKN